MTQLHITNAGPLCTLQDLGRSGYLRFGVNQSGTMDTVAASLCWKLLNQTCSETPLLEIPLGGVSLGVDTPTTVAIVSTGFRVLRDGESCGACARVTLLPGQQLDIKAGPSGQFAYVGLHAEWAVERVLGAYATHLRSGVGPHSALSAGDTFSVSPKPLLSELLALPALDHGEPVLRAMPGPQVDYFSNDAVDQFYQQTWTVGPASDRMATALIGSPLTHAKGHDILSDGIAFGAVQVPGSGQPFVLMADRGTTGGYPKIATVISADLPRVAQMRPGDSLRFARCSLAEANTLRAEQDARIALGLQSPGDVNTEQLLGVNLISGVVSAHSKTLR